MHNLEVLIREDVTTDQVIDVLNGQRKYVKCLYAYNKVDQSRTPALPLSLLSTSTHTTHIPRECAR